MRPSRSILIASAALVMAAVVAAPAHARRPRRAYAAASAALSVQPLVSLRLESPGGASLPWFSHLGSRYFAGEPGERYDLRLTNNTGERVEVVITVDGRDVVSGALGNYRRQRGYVLEPWATVVVDGFRRSLEQVAAFRFSGLERSVSGLRGTPQHVGVVGVAVFEEHRRSARRYRRARANALPPPRHDEPYYRGTGKVSRPSAFPESRRRSRGESASLDEIELAPASRDTGAFSPWPASASGPLGTADGESYGRVVQEVPFRRHRRRRPDGVLTVYYDHIEGLRARGVTSSSSPAREVTPGFAAPPPRR